MAKTIQFAFIFLMFFAIIPGSYAQENETLKGTIIETKELDENIAKSFPPGTNSYRVRVSLQEDIQVDAFSDPKMTPLSVGDKIILLKTTDPSGNDIYYITDQVRTDSILVLFLIFVAVVVLISRKAGITSLLGMAYSFFIIFKFLLPQLYSGNNPILITLFAVILIAPISFVLSHGFNKKTLTALAATIISLTLTSILALTFINSSHLSGFGSEEAYFLQLAQGAINIKGIFLAGIIIGTLGILDDATVTQTSIVSQLNSTAKNLDRYNLFSKAMSVGYDHIASTVNTLILVYTGASLPLLLLFIQSDESFSLVLNNQIIAEEVITMLVSSIGLIISIPISTLLAVYFVSTDTNSGHSHHH